jgi:hypothetical protein
LILSRFKNSIYHVFLWHAISKIPYFYDFITNQNKMLKTFFKELTTLKYNCKMSYEPRTIYNIKNNLTVKEYESLLVRLNIYI